MFLISKIVRGRRLLHQLEQQVEKEKAQQKEREKIMEKKVGGGEGGERGGYSCQTARPGRQQQTRQNSASTAEEQHGGASGARSGGADGATTAPIEHYHRPFCACPSASSAASVGAVEAEYPTTGSIELNATGDTELDGADKAPFSSLNQQKMANKATSVNQRRQRAVRQRTDSSLPSVDEETAGGTHNAKMRRTSSMPSVAELDSHGAGVFGISKKDAIQRPLKHYNYEDRLSKLHKRALRFTWQRLQTRNGGKRIETVFEEVFDRMMRSLPLMREMFNTRTFISAMSRCEIASPREHARLIVKMFESAIKNLEVEERKRTDTASDFDPNLMGRSHGVLRPYGFTSALWEAFGEAVIDVVLNQEAVRDLPGASQAWVVLTACLVDQLRAGFESSRECPFQQKTAQHQMGVTVSIGTGGAVERDDSMRQQQQKCRMRSDRSSKNEGEEEERREAAGARDNEGFLAVINSDNRRNTIASCSDSAHTDEEEGKATTIPKRNERRTAIDGGFGETTTARHRSFSRKREQRYFSVTANKTGISADKLEMKILHDMASTEL